MNQTENGNALSPEQPLAALGLELIVDAPRLAAAPHDGDAGVPAENAAGGRPRFAPLDLDELLTLDIPPRGMVLDPIIPEKGLALLYATRGTGKTHVALGIAYAVATGGTFLNWRAPRPRRVLLVDGEMPAADLRDRLRRIVAATGVTHAPGMLKILAGDLIEGGVGDLTRTEVQAALEQGLDDGDLLILDNLSSLTAAPRDNDPDSWTAIQLWLLRLRRRGISVIIVHHAGKGGDQRGTSRREDVIDTSICLQHPSDYDPTQGARFEVHIVKGRGLHGAPARAFEARLETRGDQAVWTVNPVEDVETARVRALLAEGMSVRDIAEETGIHRSTVHRLKKKLARDTQMEAAETAKVSLDQ